MFNNPSTQQVKMFSMESGREVPMLRWDLEEDDLYGPVLNDIFLGAPASPAETLSVVFVEGEQDTHNGGYYHKFNSNHAQQQQHFVTPPNGQIHPSSNAYDNNKWFDDYVSFNEETFGSSSKSLPINTGSNFPNHPINSFNNTNTEYDSNLFYSDSFANFHQPANDHQMHDLSGPSTSGNNIAATTQFAQLNIQEPSFGIDSNVPPPIPESEYSASYSAPGSAYSTDWSSGSEHSSAQSQDEILDEIVRECSEIERKSVSPPIRHKVHAKRRSNTIVKHTSNDQLASNSSNNSLSGAGNSDRKKELNRIAATKYREKKRREREMLGSEHTHLETRNHELRATAKELRTEVNYLKKLMKDMESRASQH